MLTDFKFLKFDQSINFKNKNIEIMKFKDRPPSIGYLGFELFEYSHISDAYL